MSQHRLCSCTDCAHSTILIVRDVAFCAKVLIYDKFKISFNQNNIFRNIPLWPKGTRYILHGFSSQKVCEF